MLFQEKESLLHNEFINAIWDESTGLSLEELDADIKRMWTERGDESTSIARAKIFAYILDNAAIEVNPNTPFAGKLRHGITYKNHAASGGIFEALFRYINNEVLSEKIPGIYQKKRFATSIGIGTIDMDYWHTLPEWDYIYKMGLQGILSLAIEKRKTAADDTSRIFYDSIIISYEAILRYIKRLIKQAEKMNMAEYVACLRAISTRPPQSMYEVMMLSCIYLDMEEIGVERGRTLGQIDALYLPYYLSDLAKGISQGEIINLIKFYFMHFSEALRFAAQPFCLCPVDDAGKDCSNELTRLLIQVYSEMSIRNPKIHVRWHKDIPKDIETALLKLIRDGSNAIVFINDDAVYQAYERIGIGKELSVRYLPIGCYEPVIPGVENAMIGASWTNIAKAIEFTMTGGIDIATGKRFGPETPLEFGCFDEVYHAFITQLDSMVEFVVEALIAQMPYQMDINPSPIYSSAVESCMNRGRDVFDGGMDINNTSIKYCGIATTVDSLLAIKRFVFEKKMLSFSQMREAVKNNWSGYERIRAHILHDTVKYGNHEPQADQLAHDIYKHLAQKIVGRDNTQGGVFRMGADSITFAISFGAAMAATPDGRNANAPISKNFCAVDGMEREGVTAFFESVNMIDQLDFADSTIIDFALHPSAVEGEKGIEAMRALYHVYFKNGGFAIQGNVMSLETLLEAQVNPEKYKNLQVRVCGWNEYFINMDERKQQAYIDRWKAQKTN